MTTVPKRLAIKINLKESPSFKPNAIVPIFQRWIQEHAVEGLLIDVIDYKHVPDGPGIILIADEGDYGYDFGDSQVGIRYTRKRFLPDNLADAIRLTLRLTLIATQRLEDEDLDGVEFDYNSASIYFLDRRYYRNEPEIYDAIQAELSTILSDLYDDEVTVSRTYDDPREVFTVGYTVANPVDIGQLEARLGAPITS